MTEPTDDIAAVDEPDTPRPSGRRLSQYLTSRGTRPVELLLAAVLGFTLFLPGISTYSLVDPWETHYGEVGRRLLQDDDLIHTQWQNEGFRSKPILTPWLIAGGMRALGYAENGGFSGEMVSSDWVTAAVRTPFVCFGVLGLVMLWWMLASLVNRRTAWLSFLILGTCPFYFLIARQAITDMPMVASLMGALACFAVAMEGKDRPLEPIFTGIGKHLRFRFDAHSLFALVVIVFVGWQIIYYAHEFTFEPRLAPGIRVGQPYLSLPLVMLAGLALIFGLAFVVVAITIVFALFVIPMGLFDNAVRPDVTFAIATFGGLGLTFVARHYGFPRSFWTTSQSRWWGHRPTTQRQVFMHFFSLFIGVSVLAKGLPALGIAGVCVFSYIAITGQWRQLFHMDVLRGIVILLVVAIPWHVAMWMKDGGIFFQKYVMDHNLRRASSGMPGERGTFAFYFAELGIGLFPWIALVPAAIGHVFRRVVTTTREGRVALLVILWASVSVALFAITKTKFHHYIFPAVPALALLVALWLNDVFRDRRAAIFILCVVGAALVLFIGRDLAAKNRLFIEMFVFQYTRAWPKDVDLSTVFWLATTGFSVLLVLFGIPKLRRYAFAGLAATTVVFTLWVGSYYMKPAGDNWGMRSAIRTYYKSRAIYGINIRYNGLRQLSDDWSDFGGRYRVESVIPDGFRSGLDMEVIVEVMSRNGSTTLYAETLRGPVSGFGDNYFDIALPKSELDKLAPLIKRGKSYPVTKGRPWKLVKADRLVAWKLYWRGENFWSGDEIWSRLPDTKTTFNDYIQGSGGHKGFMEYIKAPERAQKRIFVVTQAGQAKGLSKQLPTERARKTYKTLDTKSNKFTLVGFTL